MSLPILPLSSMLKGPPPKVSFEFFPPKTQEMEINLWEAIMQLALLEPHFVSVTYGAGGSTRERTHHTIRRLLSETSLKPAAHLTCVGSSRGEMDDIAREYWDVGVRHIVALRGDPPEGQAKYTPHPEGYAYAADLVAGLVKIAPFEISVAAYPEGHPEATSPAADLDNLKRKLDAGATRAISQFFFDTDMFLRFLEKARRAGITAPIVPGILPITHFKQATRFAERCGASVPAWIGQMFEGLDENPQTRDLVSATLAAEQCRMLRAAGIDEFHFYTLNRARLCQSLCRILGVFPETVPA